MSFQDLESGLRVPVRRNRESDLSMAVFEIVTAVAKFQKLVDRLGTPKDTQEHREILHKTRLSIGRLVMDTSAKLKQASEADQQTELSVAKKIEDFKRAKDFEAVVKEFQKAQRIAVDRETAYSPYVPREVLPPSYPVDRIEIRVDKIPDERAFLDNSRRQQAIIHLENEIIFNEAVIEEREEGIKEIQQQIADVYEISKDLAVLVHEQGFAIDDIEANTKGSEAATAEATTELRKADKMQKSNSSMRCLLLLIVGIILLIVVVVLVQ